MKGNPKFKYGDKVQFTSSDGIIRIGTIYIVDKYGTWDNPSDVSYDILQEIEGGDKCLYKHITESLVSKL